MGIRRTRTPASQPSTTPESAHDDHVDRRVEDGRVVSTATGAPAAESLAFTHAGSGRFSIALYPHPTRAQVDDLAEAWDLHPVLREDLQVAGQRPKAERYGDVLFLVARSARYVDRTETVEFAEFHIVARPDAIAIVCQDGEWIDGADAATIAQALGADLPDSLFEAESLLRLGPEAVAYWVLDAITDGFVPVMEGLENDKEQIERQVFAGDPSATERVYRLGQEVIDLQHAVTGLGGAVDTLRAGIASRGTSEELQTYLQDVVDHHMIAGTRVAQLRESFSQILDVNATLVAQRQNEDMKKISGWAAILFAPTLVAAIYGMNFQHMPELSLPWGYPAALLAMVAFSVVLYRVFKAKRWM